MKLYNSFIIILLSLSTSNSNIWGMEQGAEEARELKKASKIGQKETLDALTRTLKSLGILINLNAPTEQKIFAFTDNLIKKGPGGAKLVRNMIQKYAQLIGESNWENYTYSQFKLDVMDKIINEKAKEFEEAYPAEEEQRKLTAATRLNAYIWSRNEAKKNLKYQKTLNKILVSMASLEHFKLGILLGANSYKEIKLDRLQDNIIEPLIVRAAKKNMADLLNFIMKNDKNYDSKLVDELIKKNKIEYWDSFRDLEKSLKVQSGDEVALLAKEKTLNTLKQIKSKHEKTSYVPEYKASDYIIASKKPRAAVYSGRITPSLRLTPRSTITTPPQPASQTGLFGGLKNWWYGSGKEEKK